MKKVFVSWKICFKGKVLKTLETFTDCHVKSCPSLKRRAILKIPSTFFGRNYVLSVGLKVKTLRQKPTQILSQKLLKEATIHFYCLSDELRFSDICTISSCYRTVPSAIWEIFSEFLIFWNLFHEPLGEINSSKIWETRKIFANIARGNVR